MSGYTGPLKFKLLGRIPNQCPDRLVWDSNETVFETQKDDVNDPDRILKRRVFTVSAHVDVAASWTASTAFQDFMDQEKIINPVMEFPSVRGNRVVRRRLSYDFDILRNSASRIGDGNIARISLTLQSRKDYEPTYDNTYVYGPEEE